MYKMIMNALFEWNDTRSERAKLQYAYVISAIALIILAGLVGLINYDLGQQMTAVALLALAIFFVNLVVWTLLQGIVFVRLTHMSEREKAASAPVKATKKKSTKKSTKVSK